MLELTGLGSVLRGFGVAYWTLAIGLLLIALWKGTGRIGKTIGAGVVVLVFSFLPVKGAIEQAKKDAYAKEAWAYFKKKCDTEAGEKTYKSLRGVKSLLIIKPLPPATDADNYDQYWYGDPYSSSATSVRTEVAASKLVWPDGPVSKGVRGRGFDFVESVVPSRESEKKFIRYTYAEGARRQTIERIEKPVSRFAISWEDISTPEDRKYWVAGSRLRAIDLTDNTVVAERIGFLIEAGFGSKAGGRRPWLVARGLGRNGRSCPDVHDYSDRWFLLKVFKPTEESHNGK
jgi:hypothetical protein